MLPFVGRELELQRLLAHARAPRARRCLIFGERGIGKTRLVQEVGERFEGRWVGFNVRAEHRRQNLSGVVLDLPGDTQLLVLDDVDSAALVDAPALVEALSQRPGMTILMTAESEESVDPSWRTMMVTGSELTIAELEGLSGSESAALLRADGVDGEALDAMLVAAQGNPRTLLNLAAESLSLPGTDGSTLATILGPDGRSLKPGDAGFATVELSAKGISAALIAELTKKPELMYELAPRKFEELVAELYERDGFEVELTPASKDGGVDIYAVQRAPFGSFLTVVDCKRHRADLPVKVGLIEKLYGTVMAKDASVGVIATTSYFTKGAKSFQEERQHRLGLQDFISVHDMLKRARADA